jgi:hypothetical protein
MKMQTMVDRSSSLGGWLLRVILVAALAGCAAQEAKDIVRVPPQSGLIGLPDNTPLPQLPPPAKRDVGAARDDANSIQRIEAYIVAHPDQKSAIASLRIRQGVIYLDQGKYSLAAGAFDAADSTQLFTDRDQALKAVSSELIWWYQTAPLANIPGAEMGRTGTAMAALKAETAKRKASPDTRELLAEMRAWIGLKYFAALADRAKQKAVMEDTINEYATIFTPEDLAGLCAPSSAGGAAPVADQRRRLRAGPVIAQAAEYAKELTGPNKPVFREPAMQDLIAPKVPNPQCSGR